jgi:hypothetical protein
VIRELTQFLELHGMRFVEIVGKSADALQTYASQPKVRGRWRDFVPPESLAAQGKE